MNKSLFFDADPFGHHGEFLENIIGGLPLCNAHGSLMLAHPKLKKRLEARRQLSATDIKINYLTDADVARLESVSSVRRRGKLELEILDRFLKQHQVSRIVLMHMNMHQLALSRWRPPSGCKISGVLFCPCTPLDRVSGAWSKFKVLGVALRKRFQIWWMLRNRSIDRVFLLNDPRVAESLNKQPGLRKVFKGIRDPLPVSSAGAPVELETAKEPKKFVFLMLGAMSARKGCVEVLEAMRTLVGITNELVELRILGCFDPAYRMEVVEAAKHLANHPRLKVVIKNEFLSDSDMQAEFARADCVLAPYQNFYGSSGMVGHAARYRKPLLACKDGLLGELVSSLKLGICVNPKDTNAMVEAMRDIMNGDFEYCEKSAESYLGEGNYIEFTRNLTGR